MTKEDKLGVITEVGDLGLGFNEITEEEQKIIEKNEEDKKKENS